MISSKNTHLQTHLHCATIAYVLIIIVITYILLQTMCFIIRT
jgi:hypothetical protein